MATSSDWEAILWDLGASLPKGHPFAVEIDADEPAGTDPVAYYEATEGPSEGEPAHDDYSEDSFP